MNKHLFTLLLTLLLSLHAAAQKGLSISVKGGPQRASMQNANLKTSPRYGYALGAGAACGFNEKLGLGIDLLYSSEGRKFVYRDVMQSPDDIEIRQRIGYFKLPLYFMYAIRPGKRISFTAKLGPQLSFLLHSEFLDGAGAVIYRNTNAFYEDLVVGGMAGFDLNARLTKKLLLSLGARCDMSISNTESVNLLLLPNKHTTRNLNPGVFGGLTYIPGR